jgi:hypothetical protein
MRRVIWASFLACTFLSLVGSGKSWNGITPCETNRLQAEKVLGRESDRPIEIGIYDSKKAVVTLFYSQSNKNAPQTDIVTHISVAPKDPVLLAKYVKLIPDFYSTYIKQEMDPKVSHIGYLAHYINVAERFEITVQKNDNDAEVITRYSYYKPEKGCEQPSLNQLTSRLDVITM